MEKDLVNIIVEKKYIELSTSELTELKEFCSSEEEYNQMRDVFMEVESISFDSPKPKAETKKSLDNLFNETYPKVPVAWYSSFLTVVIPKDKPIHRQPLLQVAAICLLFIMIVPFFNSDVTVKKNQIAKVEDITDSKTDIEVDTKVNEIIEDKNIDNGRQPSEVELAKTETEVLSMESDEFIPEELGSVTFTTNGVMPTVTAFSTNFSAEFDHPDGIFDATIAEVDYSMTVSELPDVLDLLTTTF